MSIYTATIQWKRSTTGFEYKTFDRTHTWRFPGGQAVQASAAPDYFGDSNFTNPEEGLVAALASCQMLTFLSIAALKGFIVDTYEDQPEGVLGKNERGNIMVVEVTLRPKVVFAGNRRPDANDVEHMHLAAHEKCFIANSLLTRVVMAPR